MTHIKKTFLVSLCIALTLMGGFKLIIGAYSGILFATGIVSEKALNLHDFEWVDVEPIDEMSLITATDDTQLLLTAPLINLYIKCSFSLNPGEIVLFYQNSPSKGFTTKKMLHAQIENGYYKFQLPLNTKKIRLDTGIFPSVKVEFEEIIANQFTLKDLFRFSPQDIFLLALLTLLSYGTLSWIQEENLMPLSKKKEKEKEMV